MHFVAVHARHVEAIGIAGSVEHGVVTGAFGAEAEVVAHQHVPGAETFDQDIADKLVRRLQGQPLVEWQHDGLRYAAGGQLCELVAQRADAGWRQFGSLGQRSKVVAGMRLESQHATR